MTVDAAKKGGDRVNNVSPTGQPVKRITSATQAHAVFERLKKHNEKTAKDRSRIQGQIDGNSPYSDAELRRIGQGWRCNVNFREAEAAIDETVNMYWQLIMEVPSLIHVRVKPSYIAKNNLNIDKTADYEEIIEEEFTEQLRAELSFFYNVTLKASEMIKYGLGPTMFNDEDDWMFEAIKNASCLIPAKTKSTTDKNQFVCLRSELTLDEIFALYTDEETRKIAKFSLRKY